MTITSKIGFGNDISGEAVILPPKEFGSRDLTLDLSEKILILSNHHSREFLEKARFVGVLGVVVPSIHFRDYDYFKTVSGFGMMILLRFGDEGASGELAEKLNKLAGKTVKLSGDGKKLEIL